jgi:hypothetical protein
LRDNIKLVAAPAEAPLAVFSPDAAPERRDVAVLATAN